MDTNEKPLIAGAAVRKNAVVEATLIPLLGNDGNQRQEEIILDHALAKSSNVGSPINGSFLESELFEAKLSTGNTNGCSPHERINDESKYNNHIDPPKSNTLQQLEIVDLEDDFFSMSYKPKLIEVPKKKKKRKKVKRKHTESPALEEKFVTGSISPSSPSRPTNEIVEIGSDDVIEVEEVDASEVKRPKLVRQITPPPISEEEFRKLYKARKRSEDYEDDFQAYNEPDHFASRLARLDQVASTLCRERTATRTTTSESLDDDEEKQVKEYSLNITSFVPGSNDHAIILKVKGTKKIDSIISKVLSYLLSLDDLVHSQYQFLYKPELVVLYHNQFSMHPLMKVDTALKSSTIAPGKTIEICLYTTLQAAKIEEDKKRAEEVRIKQIQRDEEYEKMINSKVDNQVEDIYANDFKDIDEESAAKATQHQYQRQPEERQEDGDYFKIGLKGEDNKKIIVKVRAETKLMDLVKHYFIKKGLPLDTKVRLDFDDEEMDLLGTVGDTELEEDFTVDVYIL